MSVWQCGIEDRGHEQVCHVNLERDQQKEMHIFGYEEKPTHIQIHAESLSIKRAAKDPKVSTYLPLRLFFVASTRVYFTLRNLAAFGVK